MVTWASVKVTLSKIKWPWGFACLRDVWSWWSQWLLRDQLLLLDQVELGYDLGTLTVNALKALRSFTWPNTPWLLTSPLPGLSSPGSRLFGLLKLPPIIPYYSLAIDWQAQDTVTLLVLLQNRQGVHNILLWEGSPFLALGSPPPATQTPTRFAMPATIGKTSLHARDWWKGKKLFI